MAGRYTAYQVYQHLRFPEADRAGAQPYTGKVYRCPHSQRGLQPNYSNFRQRQHFDAANTSCCNEPVSSVGNKPQYRGAAKPWSPSDCQAKAKVAACSIPQLGSFDTISMCGITGKTLGTAKARCASKCQELWQVQKSGGYSGNSGRFSFVGQYNENDILVRYSPYESLLREHYDECKAATTYYDSICSGGISVRFSLKDGLNPNSGCSCDCCNVNGNNPSGAPSASASWSVPSSTWANEVLVGTVTVSEACSSGTISGSFEGSSAHTRWTGSTTPYGGSGTRYTRRTGFYVGTAAKPACCGGTIGVSFSNGCGTNGSDSGSLAGKIVSTSLTPADGTHLTNSATMFFRLDDACSYAAAAAITKDASYCLSSGAFGNPVRVNGVLALRYVPINTADGTCNRCCGRGTITVSSNDGCGNTKSQDYTVGTTPLATDNTIVGRAWRCVGSGAFWRSEYANIECDGDVGTFTFYLGYSSEADCQSGIAGYGPNALCNKPVGGCADVGVGSTGYERIGYGVSDRCCSWIGDTSSISYTGTCSASSCCP